MTCVLSMTPLYANPCYSEEGNDLQNKNCENFDFNWINSQSKHTTLSETHRCSTPCRIEASTGTTISCRVEVTSAVSGTVKHDSFILNNVTCYETELNPEEKVGRTDKPLSTNGHSSVNTLFEMCNKTDAGPSHLASSNQGTKRKAEVTGFDDVYIPSKRVSPFLNTPKERKDERKKILKISIKKLKQLDDPEAFLRRTVLVNNTLRRLQSELREEKLRSKKFESNKKKSFSGYGVLNNNCLSNSYLFDDPFLSGVHEKITDDMTETLMNNVFHDKPNENTEDTVTETVAPKSDNECNSCDSPLLHNDEVQSRGSEARSTGTDSCNMDICESDSKVECSLVTSMDISDDSSNLSISSTHVTVLCKDHNQNCSKNRTETQEIPVGFCDISTCEELVRTSRCIINNNEKNSKLVCHDNGDAMMYSECKSGCIENFSERTGSYGIPNTKCVGLNSANLDFEKSTDVQINSTDTAQKRLHSNKDNSLISSKSAINEVEVVSENTYGLDLLDLDQKLDQKSLSHSFNTFLSAFDINHPEPISLSYKES